MTLISVQSINVEVDIAPVETARTGFIMVACVMYGYTFFV